MMRRLPRARAWEYFLGSAFLVAAAMAGGVSCRSGRPPAANPPIVVGAVPFDARAPASPRAPAVAGTAFRFRVTLANGLASDAGPAPVTVPVTGRLLLVIARGRDGQGGAPRTMVSDRDDTAQIFGVDVSDWRPGSAVVIDGSTLGYPAPSLAALPAGDYVVEAVLHRYETFHRSDGRVISLPPDRGEGQDWSKAPGNFVSSPQTVHIDPGKGGDVPLALTQVLPPLPPVADSKYVKYYRMRSERLSKFWGRPVDLGAIVLVPEGWETHPSARYPVLISHGHFEREAHSFRESPPDATLPAVDLEHLRQHCPNGHEKEACTKYGYERLQQEAQFALYKKWTGKGFPRFLAVTIQHANPYYDDSYAVNSENVGPYGDAITYELIPAIEKQFRGLGPWARGLVGGSTGGWEALAAQVFYPNDYNGAIANCPDPIDFRAYTTLDLYDDPNAYWSEGTFRRTPRPASRDFLGRTRSTMEQDNRKELVLGTHGRSGGQWDIWQAVFSPVGEDGYPKPIWDKLTGTIDPSVAAYWKEHYDLGHILARDWSRIGPLLRGKITLNVGLSDNFFLNDAVYLVDDFLKSASPPADATVAYGARDEHCWSGDQTTFNAVSRLTYLDRFGPKLIAHWLRTAPKGADLTSWRY